MKRKERLFLFVMVAFALGACTPKAEEVLPEIPDKNQEEQSPVVFKGLWVSTCNEESVDQFKSQRTEYRFDKKTLFIQTMYFLEDECFAMADSKEVEGEFKLSNKNTEGNNLVSYNEKLNGSGAVKKYIRTMSIDGQFIITSPQFSQQGASAAVADIPLYREDEWLQIQENIDSKLPESSVTIEPEIYQWDQDSSCQIEVLTGKPSEASQKVYLLPNERCNSLEFQFICEKEASSCEASNSLSQDWTLEQSKKNRLILNNLSSNELFTFNQLKK